MQSEVSWVKCDVCNHKWIAIRPVDLDKLECPNCGNMVGYEIIEKPTTPDNVDY